MQNTARRPKLTVSGDGTGTVSHAGALLLTETARVTGAARRTVSRTEPVASEPRVP
jgi:hypothetical protein